MGKETLVVCDGFVQSDRRELSGQALHTVVLFDLDQIADLIGAPREEIMRRMLDALARAITLDAVEMAADEMRASGRMLARDGFPEDWPLLHLASIVQARFFPELAQ